MTITCEREAFLDHLDECHQCAQQPFNLCMKGTRLLWRAAQISLEKQTFVTRSEVDSNVRATKETHYQIAAGSLRIHHGN